MILSGGAGWWCRGVRYNFYSMSKYLVFQCGIWGIPVRDMEYPMQYSTAGYGVFQCWVWSIPLRDMGYAVNWV